MDENRYIRIAVEPMDALPDVLTKVRTHGGRPVFLSIPPASPLFLTASEFRALRETVRASNTNLVVVSEDRQRQDFARLFNLIPAADEAEAIAWIDGQSAQKPSSSQAIDPALGPPRSGNGSGWAPRTEVIRPNEASGSVPQIPEPEPVVEPAATNDGPRAGRGHRTDAGASRSAQASTLAVAARVALCARPGGRRGRRASASNGHADAATHAHHHRGADRRHRVWG